MFMIGIVIGAVIREIYLTAVRVWQICILRVERPVRKLGREKQGENRIYGIQQQDFFTRCKRGRVKGNSKI